MKITMYELLGMIKDGKAPKNIKCYGYIFEYDTNHLRYESYFDKQILTLNDFVNVNDNLNDEVEIIEEPKGIPKKLKSLNNVGNVSNLVEFIDKQQLNNHLLKDKLNEIIDYLESKGDE